MRVVFRVRMRAGIRAWVLEGVGDSSIGERLVGEEAAGVVQRAKGKRVVQAVGIMLGVYHVHGIICAL